MNLAVPADLPRYAALPEPVPPRYVLVQEELAIEEAQQRAHDAREAQRDALVQGEPPEPRGDLGLWAVLVALAVMVGMVVAERRAGGRIHRRADGLTTGAMPPQPQNKGQQAMVTLDEIEQYVRDLGQYGYSTAAEPKKRYMAGVAAGMLVPRGWDAGYLAEWRGRVECIKQERERAVAQARACIAAIKDLPKWLVLGESVDSTASPLCGAVLVQWFQSGRTLCAISLRPAQDWSPEEQADAILSDVSRRLGAMMDEVTAARNAMGRPARAAWQRRRVDAGADQQAPGGAVIKGPWMDDP